MGFAGRELGLALVLVLLFPLALGVVDHHAVERMPNHQHQWWSNPALLLTDGAHHHPYEAAHAHDRVATASEGRVQRPGSGAVAAASVLAEERCTPSPAGQLSAATWPTPRVTERSSQSCTHGSLAVTPGAPEETASVLAFHELPSVVGGTPYLALPSDDSLPGIEPTARLVPTTLQRPTDVRGAPPVPPPIARAANARSHA